MKKIFTLFAVILLTQLNALAQIKYTDILPDTTVNTWHFYKIVPATSTELYIWFHPFSPNQVVINAFGCEVLWNGGYPARLNAGDVIGSTGTWAAPLYDTLNIAGKYGNWVHNGMDKYLGFSFTLSGQPHYGWLKMDIDSTPTMFTVKEWAYNTVPNASIKAGEKTGTVISETLTGKPAIAVHNKLISFIDQGNKSYQAIVCDIAGQILLRTPLQGNHTIDLNGYPAGMYLLRLENEKDQFTYKLSID